MPITVGNFTKLASEGFYNGTKFHRVIEGFMIQGGDPNTKTDDTASYGTGGPGYTIQDEFVANPLLSNVPGTIAMANTGQPNSGGSQFFINTAANTFLDFDKEPMTSRHPVFGRVITGLEVIDTISTTPTGPGDQPIDPVVIESVVLR
jgi:peptidylprolyl isomerase